jgi:cation diffusion facilitator family transporter
VAWAHGHAHGQPPGHGTERLRSVRVALVVALALLALKLGVYFATGLIVMLAEAFHSLTDALLIGALLIAARLSALPPDEGHPFGHGRGENLAAVVASLLFVFLLAVELVREAWGALAEPRPPPVQPALALGVLALGAVMMVWPLMLARRDMRQHGGVVRAQAVEALNDILGIGAAAAGILAVMAGYPAGDAIAALVVAGIIGYNAIGLFRANLPYLVGGSPPHEFYTRVERTALEVEGALGVHSMAAEYIGPSQVHLDLHLTVRAEMTIEEADRLAHRVRDRLEEAIPELGHSTIHFCASRGELRRVGRDPEGRRVSEH